MLPYPLISFSAFVSIYPDHCFGRFLSLSRLKSATNFHEYRVAAAFLFSRNNPVWQTPLIPETSSFNNFQLFDISHDQQFYQFCVQQFNDISANWLNANLQSFAKHINAEFNVPPHNIFIALKQLVRPSIYSKLIEYQSCLPNVSYLRKREKRISKRSNYDPQRICRKLLSLKSKRPLNCYAIAHRINEPYHQVRKFFKDSKHNDQPLIVNKIFLKKWIVDEEDMNCFQEYFQEVKLQVRTINELLQGFRSKYPKFSGLSRSSFYKLFIKKLNLTPKKPKFIKYLKNPIVANTERKLFMASHFYFVRQNYQTFFFDECSFDLHHNKSRMWELAGTKVLIHSKMTPASLRLMMVCSYEKIECLKLTNRSTLGEDIVNFLKEFILDKIANQDRRSNKILIVLDNSTKNRVDGVKKLVSNNRVNLQYIVPNTPALNFIENVFKVLKEQVYKEKFEERYS